jgi:hypothetical protein
MSWNQNRLIYLINGIINYENKILYVWRRERKNKRGRYQFKAFPGTKFYNGEDITKEDMNVRTK